MKVFVTGANGFVGLNIVNALIEAGHTVTALTRKLSNTSYLDQFAVQKVEGSLNDNKFLNNVLQGKDAVIHTAGITGCKKSELPKLIEVNAEGTRNICQAAKNVGIHRFVFTSTTSTIGAENNKNSQADESSVLTGFRANNPYGISKKLAEQYVMDAADSGMHAVILNPAEVVGPYDYNLQWGRIVMAVAYNQLPFLPPGGGSFCHAAEVGRAHVAALNAGCSGEKHILAGANVSFIEYIETIEKLLQTRSDRPKGNYWFKYFKALLNENFPYLKTSKPAVEAYRMRVFGGHYYFSSAKAEKELGYRVTGLEHMLKDSVEWYRQAGMVPVEKAG